MAHIFWTKSHLNSPSLTWILRIAYDYREMRMVFEWIEPDRYIASMRPTDVQVGIFR